MAPDAHLHKRKDYRLSEGYQFAVIQHIRENNAKKQKNKINQYQRPAHQINIFCAHADCGRRGVFASYPDPDLFATIARYEMCLQSVKII